MSDTKNTFVPMRLQAVPAGEISSNARLTVTGTLKGSAAEDFQKLMEKYSLNRSQLMVQMVYHCLGKTSELKDFYKRLAILGE